MSLASIPSSRQRRGEHGAAVAEIVAVAVLVLAIGVVVWVATGRIEDQASSVECRNELREVKVAAMNYEALTGQPPSSTAQLLAEADPVRGGRLLDERPEHYEVGVDGVVVRRDGASSNCPTP